MIFIVQKSNVFILKIKKGIHDQLTEKYQINIHFQSKSLS
jgi:hypothetical protein